MTMQTAPPKVTRKVAKQQRRFAKLARATNDAEKFSAARDYVLGAIARAARKDGNENRANAARRKAAVMLLDLGRALDEGKTP